jgi:hypothetical protein
MIGDILVDGETPKAVSGKEMCEYVIAAGLFQGTPEQLWCAEGDGSLVTCHELYWKALAKNGHNVEIDLGNKMVPIDVKPAQC